MKAIEILELREQLAILESNIKNAENYIAYLKKRYPNPLTTVGKYNEKITQWKKEKWEVEKELLVLENNPCNS